MQRFIIWIATLMIALGAYSQQAPSQSAQGPQSVGLVLSGGGAKGIAHIGVIQALEDNNIPIDYISGTSMGAIVGSLYACGFTPQEMMQVIGSDDFAAWSTGTIDKRRTYYFLQDEPLPTILNLTFGDKDSKLINSILPSSLINPLPMNFAFMELFAPYTAQCGGNFNNLFVPFRSVCSDMTNKRMVVNSSGSLSDAVRASMSFPLVFKPIERDGALLYDGGIYDNFPVDVMRESFAPQIMIGVDVAATGTDNGENIYDQLETMIMQHSNYNLPARQGIKIRLHLEQFGLLDFPKAKQIYQLGYDKAMSMMDSIKSRIHSRIPAEARTLRRQVFKSQTPALVFDSISVSGGTQQQNDYIEAIFRSSGQEDITLNEARQAYYRTITPGKLKNLEPTAVYNPSTGKFTLQLKATLKNNLFFGLGGYLSTSTNNMMFLTTGYKTLSFNSLDLRLNGWVGQSYLAAEASAHIRLLRHNPSSLQLQAVVSRQKFFNRDKMFFQTSEPTSDIASEYFARLTFGLAAGQRGKIDLGVGVGRIENHAYPVAPFSGFESLSLRQNLLQARVNYQYNTLNNYFTPSSGTFFKATAIGVTGNTFSRPTFTDNQITITTNQHSPRHWLQAEVDVKHYSSFSSKFSLGYTASALFSSRKLLPTYIESIILAPEFNPSVSYSNVFTPDFRANSYIVAGIEPIVKISSIFQLRSQLKVFAPLRPILAADNHRAVYGHYFDNTSFFAQLEGVITLPFANISAYTHYAGVEGGRWNIGISFGFYLKAPSFLH